MSKRLIRISEECCEVGKVICKIQRFGRDYTNPKTGRTNYEELYDECADLVEVISQLFDIEDQFFKAKRGVKAAKILKWIPRERPTRTDKEIGQDAYIETLKAEIRKLKGEI